jgi:hypothetical protein
MDIRNRVIEYRLCKASELVANPKNWRGHSKRQRQAYRDLVSEIGFAGAELTRLLPDGRLMLIDGHMRQEEHPEAELPVLVTDLDEDEADALLAVFDPLGAMAEAKPALLKDLLDSTQEKYAGLTEALQAVAEANQVALEQSHDESPGDPGAAISRAEALRDKYDVQKGQLWIVGKHRVLCGDAYSLEDRDLLLDGQKPSMLHIDPPYGINIVKPKSGQSAADGGGAKPFGSTAPANRKGDSAVAERNSGKVGGGRGDESSRHARAGRGHVQHGSPSKNQWSKNHPEYMTIKGDVGRVAPSNIVQSNLYPVIEGDDRPFDPESFLDFAPITIMWGGNYFADRLPISSCWICWDKREDITRNNFADGELAWTNMNKPMRVFHHLWNGLHKGSQWGEARTHPTEKPVALFEEIGKMYSPDGLWLDLFAGTGAQIVAAERAGISCYACEIEPLYVATILERLTGMGLAARRE